MEYYYRILRKQTLPMNELLHCALYGVHLLILSYAVRTKHPEGTLDIRKRKGKPPPFSKMILFLSVQSTLDC